MPSPGMWSVNTWIIALCVAVFMLDSLMSPRFVHLFDQPNADIDQSQIDQTRVVEGVRLGGQFIADPDQLADLKRELVRRQGGLETSLVLAPEGIQVGKRIYSRMGPFTEWLHFSSAHAFQFWRLIGFQFLHASVSHLLFNMIGLYFFGGMVERYLGSKRYLAFYLLAGICGAAMYLVLNLGGVMVELASSQPVRIPGLLFDDPGTPLVGASAGVFGVLMAGAFLAPNATVLLFFIIPMALRTMAYAFVIIALITVITSGPNAGGEAGHLGGAIAGWYFIRHPQHLHNFFDVIGWLDPTSHHYRGERSKHRNQAIAKMNRPKRRGPSRTEIDRVLDKVHQEGLGSLSDKEKKILRDASEKGS